MKSGLLKIFIRILIVIILLAGVLLIVMQCSGTPFIRKAGTAAPSISDAPYQVSTPMRTYYGVAKVEKESSGNVQVVTLQPGWYEQVNSKWVKRNTTLTLNAKIYGHIDVSKRQSNS